MSKEHLQFWIFVKEFKTVYHQIRRQKIPKYIDYQLRVKKSK